MLHDEGGGVLSAWCIFNKDLVVIFMSPLLLAVLKGRRERHYGGFCCFNLLGIITEREKEKERGDLLKV